MKKTFLWWVCIVGGAAGLLARLVLSAIAVGTNDAQVWRLFAAEVSAHGLGPLYAAEPDFNHPPLVSLFIAKIFELSERLGVSFFPLFRFPGIIADAAVAVVLYRLLAAKRGRVHGAVGFLLFAWNPVNLLISGFHGNTDPLYAALTFFAAVVISRGTRPGAAGLLLGAAMNVKLIPSLFLPPFTVSFETMRARAVFVAVALLSLVTYAVAAVQFGAPFIDNVVRYNPGLGLWGLQMLLAVFGAAITGGSTTFAAMEWYQANGRLLVFGVIGLFALSMFRRRRSPFEAGAITALLFLIVAPGIGVQYFAVFPPLLFAVSVPLGAALSFLAGVHLLLVYRSGLISWSPLEYKYAIWPMDLILLGFFVWLAMVFVVMRLLRAPAFDGTTQQAIAESMSPASAD